MDMYYKEENIHPSAATCNIFFKSIQLGVQWYYIQVNNDTWENPECENKCHERVSYAAVAHPSCFVEYNQSYPVWSEICNNKRHITYNC